MKKLQFIINNEIFNVWYIQGPTNAPVLHWSHGNGLNAASYENLLKQFSEYFQVYAWDARGHGTNFNLKLPEKNNIFDQYTDDLIDLVDLLSKNHQSSIIVSGHSFGATLSIQAEKVLKGKISKLILADPVIFTPFVKRVTQLMRLLKFKKPRALYLAQNAVNRQNIWKSKEAAALSLSKQKPYRYWDSVSLNNYIKYGLTETENGVELSCPRELEATIFQEGENQNLTSDIINLSVDTYVYMASKGSPSFGNSSFRRSAQTKSKIIIPSTNHLFPIEQYKLFSDKMIANII